ncbi:MAG TPA: hypothetical protein VHS81_05490 [Caulobacteraceae bacterium]|nr:hypothetical protein [Caulobacteraceae bacterium]
MRHARDEDLDRIEPLLARIRAAGAGVLKEKKRGCFYVKSKGFLHFHEDPEGMFADIEDDRIRIDDPAGAAELLARVAAVAARA